MTDGTCTIDMTNVWYPVPPSPSAGAFSCNTYAYYARAIVACLPAWFRFAQCLRRYRDTRQAFPHLVNAGKYSTTFFVVIFASLTSTTKGISNCCNFHKIVTALKSPPPQKKKKKIFGFWSLHALTKTCASAFLVFFFLL